MSSERDNSPLLSRSVNLASETERSLPAIADSPRRRSAETSWPGLGISRRQYSISLLQDGADPSHDTVSNLGESWRGYDNSREISIRSGIHGTHHSTNTYFENTRLEYSSSNACEKMEEKRERNLTERVSITFNELWLSEFGLLVVSFACFAAAFVILKCYDHINVHQWRHRISLNTTVSLLLVVGGAALAGPLSAIIGQAKWLWFKKQRRPLVYFQSFEGASRGPMGSIAFLARRRGGWVNSVSTSHFLGITANQRNRRRRDSNRKRLHGVCANELTPEQFLASSTLRRYPGTKQ